MRKHQLQVHKLTILSMMIALDVVLTPIFRIEGMAPMSSVVNILAGIMMGPVYALAMATVTAFIRMTTQGIPPLALTGATFGALLAGLFYKYGRKFHFLLWYSLQDQLLSLAGLSTRLDFSEQP